MGLQTFQTACGILHNVLGNEASGDRSTGHECLSVSGAGWLAIVSLVAGRGGRRRSAKALPLDPLLATPRACREVPVADLEVSLRRSHLAARAAGLLQNLAAWWIRHFDEQSAESGVDEPLTERKFSVTDRALRELRDIRGVSRELGERIQLFALHQPVPPVGRAAQRIFCRHGWLDPQSDLEEWQSTLKQFALAGEVSLRQLTVWLDAVGDQWCGPRPQCGACPLRELLPVDGPIEIQDD